MTRFAHAVRGGNCAFARRAFVLASAFLLCSCVSPTQPPSKCESQVTTYRYPGEPFYGERFEPGGWKRFTSEFPPKDVTAENKQAYEKMANELMPTVDCSTPEVDCLRTFNKVFAVPKGAITPGEQYVAAGANITIEGCVRSVGAECAAAVYVSDCRSADRRPTVPAGRIDGNDCRLGGRGEQIVFIFDRDRGVIAYEPADWWVHGTDVSAWDLSTLGTSAGFLALVEHKGLLACGADR